MDFQDVYLHPGGVLSPSLWDDAWLSEADGLKHESTLASSPLFSDERSGKATSPLPNDVDMLWMEKSFNLESLTELQSVTPIDVLQMTGQDTEIQDSQVKPEFENEKATTLVDSKEFLKTEGIEELLHDYIDNEVYSDAQIKKEVPVDTSVSDGPQYELKNLLHDYAGNSKQKPKRKHRSPEVKRLGTNITKNSQSIKGSSTLLKNPQTANIDAIVYLSPVTLSKQSMSTSSVLKKNEVIKSSPMSVEEIACPTYIGKESQMSNADIELIDLSSPEPVSCEEIPETEKPANVIPYLPVTIVDSGAPVTVVDSRVQQEAQGMKVMNYLNKNVDRYKPILPKIDAESVSFLENLLKESYSNTLFDVSPKEKQPQEIIITVDPSVYSKELSSSPPLFVEQASPSQPFIVEQLSPSLPLIVEQPSPSQPLIVEPPSPSQPLIVEQLSPSHPFMIEQHIPSLDSPSLLSHQSDGSNTDDSDWLPTPTSHQYKGSRRSRLAPQQKRERKKEQNKIAAIRYRVKKKDEVNEIGQLEAQLTQKNVELKGKLGGITAEIKYLKGLLRDLYKAKGLL